MAAPHTFRYLSRADVEAVGCSMNDIVGAVELVFREKAAGATIMPPKHWIAPSNRRFFSAMSSALPRISAAGCKWQSGSPDNGIRGQPYITGQYLLNDLDSGLPLAIMDSTWITEMRTAAATAVAARVLCNGPPRTIGMLGCGLQARRHVEALSHVLPSIQNVRCYDVRADAAASYRRDMMERYAIDVTICGTPRDAFDSAEIVVTTGPIAPDTPRLARADWLDPGATAVTIDYDCYWAHAELGKVDHLFTDDIGQLEHTKPEGYFVGTPPSLREISGVVAGSAPGRTSARDKIICVNMGIALEDVACAVILYKAAQERGIGIDLPI